MTVTSQNGWSANDRSLIASYALPGGRVALRAGDVSVVLLWCANRWHQTVEPLVWPGIWGYAERTIRGSSTTLSNHASGTAIDLNAPKHPLGARGTLSTAQVRAVHAITDFCEGVVRWGGDYTGRVDEMHLEINAGAAAVKRIADKIRAANAPPPPPPVHTPSPTRHPEDAMYIKCESVKGGAIWTGLLSGGLLIPFNAGETASADNNIIKNGALVQWVERPTWDGLIARSRA